MTWTKNYVILVDGKPNRYYKDGQIKTYLTFKTAEKSARKLLHKYEKVEIGKFAATELVEITKEGVDAN